MNQNFTRKLREAEDRLNKSLGDLRAPENSILMLEYNYKVGQQQLAKTRRLMDQIEGKQKQANQRSYNRIMDVK